MDPPITDGQQLLEAGLEKDLQLDARHCEEHELASPRVLRRTFGFLSLACSIAVVGTVACMARFMSSDSSHPNSEEAEFLNAYEIGPCIDQAAVQIGQYKFITFCNSSTYHPYGSDDAQHGGTSDPHQTAAWCQAWCSRDANCLCVRHNTTSGRCHKQLNCDSTKFLNSTDHVVYAKTWAGEQPSFQTDRPAEVMSPVDKQLSFTIAVLPDTQFMTAADNPWVRGNPRNATPAKLYSQVDWILANEGMLNIKAVIHLGDFVEQGCDDFYWDTMRPGWSKMRASGIPYSINPGNHDCDHIYECEPAGWDCYNRHMKEYFEDISFPVEYQKPGQHQSMLTKFEAIGVKFLLIAVSWHAPPDEIAWVDQQLTKYADRKTILHTHYVPASPELLDVASKHGNVILIVQGHECVDNQEWHKEHGRWSGQQPFVENLVDYQCSDNGYLKFYVFNLASNSKDFAVTGYSYNPYLRQMRWGQPWNFGFCTGPSNECEKLKVCSEPWGNCHHTHCCKSEGDKCYAKDHTWSACRPTCIPGTRYDDPPWNQPWSCEVLS